MGEKEEEIQKYEIRQERQTSLVQTRRVKLMRPRFLNHLAIRITVANAACRLRRLMNDVSGLRASKQAGRFLAFRGKLQIIPMAKFSARST